MKSIIIEKHQKAANRGHFHQYYHFVVEWTEEARKKNTIYRHNIEWSAKNKTKMLLEVPKIEGMVLTDFILMDADDNALAGIKYNGNKIEFVCVKDANGFCELMYRPKEG